MGTEPRIRVSAHPELGRADPALPAREGRAGVLAASRRRCELGREPRPALHRELAEEVGINDEIPVEGPVAIVDSIAPVAQLDRETRRPHHLLGRPRRAVARGGDVARCGRSRAQAVRRRGARRGRAPSADPALPGPLAPRGSRGVPRAALGALAAAQRLLAGASRCDSGTDTREFQG